MIKNILISILLISLFFPGISISAQEEQGEQGEMPIVNSDMEIIMNADMKFMFCEDYQCSKEKTDFFTNEPFFLNYKSNIKLPMVAHIRSLNTNFEDSISLPDYYVFKEEGDYEIAFEIQMENFKNITKKRKIEVISKCNPDGQCLDGETRENCSQDCVLVGPSVFNLKNIVLFVGLIFSFGLIFFGYRIIKRKQN